MVLLVERAGVDPELDRDLAGGKRVLPHRIMDAVGERAEGPGLVAWNIAAAIEPVRVAGGMDRHRDEDEKKGEQAAVEEGHRVLASEGATVWKRQMDRGGRSSFCRTEEHTSELQSLMRISYAAFLLKEKNKLRYV